MIRILCQRVLQTTKGYSTTIYRNAGSEVVPKVRSVRQMVNTKKNVQPIKWFLLMIPVSAFGLGTWQVKRKKWKEDLLKSLADRTSLEPVELPEELSELSEMEYHPVRVCGKFDHSREILIGPRSLIVDGDAGSSGRSIISSSGQIGWHVITPLSLSDRDLTILVNRGWIPNEQKNPRARTDVRTEDEVELVGIVRHGEKRQQFAPENQINAGLWYYRDLDKMAAVTGASPIFIDAVVSSKADSGPVGGQTRISLRNEHFSYIITWYGLSVSTTYMWYRHFFRKVPKL